MPSPPFSSFSSLRRAGQRVGEFMKPTRRLDWMAQWLVAGYTGGLVGMQFRESAPLGCTTCTGGSSRQGGGGDLRASRSRRGGQLWWVQKKRNKPQEMHLDAGSLVAAAAQPPCLLSPVSHQMFSSLSCCPAERNKAQACLHEPPRHPAAHARMSPPASWQAQPRIPAPRARLSPGTATNRILEPPSNMQ